MRGLVLSLFPGIGMLDMAFEHEGFTVVRGPLSPALRLSKKRALPAKEPAE